MRKAIDNVVSKTKSIFSNTYVNAFLTIFVIVYVSLARPELPDFMMKLFDNPLFRLLVLIGIAFIGSRDIQSAILVAVTFTIIMNLLNEKKVVNGYSLGTRPEQ